jgi:hypothetical protein
MDKTSTNDSAFMFPSMPVELSAVVYTINRNETIFFFTTQILLFKLAYYFFRRFFKKQEKFT